MEQETDSSQQQWRQPEVITLFDHVLGVRPHRPAPKPPPKKIGPSAVLSGVHSRPFARGLRAAAKHGHSTTDFYAAKLVLSLLCCSRKMRAAIRSISSLQWSFIFFNRISSRRSSEFR